MKSGMASGLRPSDGVGIFVAALALALAVLFARPAGAFGRWLFGDGLNKPPPRVARYDVDLGGAFVLDSEAHQALVKFSDSPEVWVLWPFRGPRGDVIYKNDVGDPMLRATKLGGMTVFTPRHPNGAAAALDGATSPLRLPPLGPAALYDRLYQASVRTTRAAQHTIEFYAPDVDPGSDGLIADAALVVMQAMIVAAERPHGHAILARVGTIAISAGQHPAVALRGRVVAITVNPDMGFAGRPSSERILLALGAR
jgi:hypothetical protein